MAVSPGQNPLTVPGFQLEDVAATQDPAIALQRQCAIGGYLKASDATKKDLITELHDEESESQKNREVSQPVCRSQKSAKLSKLSRQASTRLQRLLVTSLRDALLSRPRRY